MSAFRRSLRPEYGLRVAAGRGRCVGAGDGVGATEIGRGATCARPRLVLGGPGAARPVAGCCATILCGLGTPAALLGGRFGRATGEGAGCGFAAAVGCGAVVLATTGAGACVGACVGATLGSGWAVGAGFAVGAAVGTGFAVGWGRAVGAGFGLGSAVGLGEGATVGWTTATACVGTGNG